MEKKNISGHIACIVAFVIFGLNIILCKDLTSGGNISPLAIFTLRSLGAGALFWILSIFLPKEKVELKDFPKIFAASFLGFFLCQVTFLIALPEVTPMDCSLLAALAPIYTMIIAAFALKEPITSKKVIGVLTSLAGIVIMTLSTMSGKGNGETSTIKGLIIIALGSISFSLYLGLFKPLISKYSVVTFMKWIFLFAFIMTAPFTTKEIITLEWSTIPTSQLLELLFLIVCATFITYFLIPYGQKHIRPTLVSLYSYIQPITAICISIAIGMDTLTWQKIVAIVMVFGGVIIVNRSATSKKSNLKNE